MNRSKKFMYNSSVAVVYQVIVMVVGFVIPKVMITYYGSEVNGLVTSITQFMSYFLLVEAGLSSAAVYSLYQPLAEDDHQGVSEIVVATQTFYLKSGAIFLVLVTALAAIYPQFARIESLNQWDIFFLVLALGCNGIVDFFTLGKYRAILSADQKTYVISLSSIVYYLVNTMVITVCARGGLNVALGRVVAASSILIRTGILMHYVRSHYPYLDYRASPNVKALDKRWAALYMHSLGIIQNGTPVIALTFLENFVNLSIYAVYNMILLGVRGILDVFINGLQAGFGELIAKKETITLQKAYSDFEFMYYAIIAIVYPVTATLILPFVSLFTRNISDFNYLYPTIGLLFVVNNFLYSLKTPQGMLVFSAGLFRETRVQSTIQALIILVLTYPFGKTWGIPGILLASCLSNFYRVIDLVFYASKHITGLPAKLTAKRLMSTTIVSLLNYWLCQRFVSVVHVTIGSWLMMAVRSVIISTVTLLIWQWVVDRSSLYRLGQRIQTIIRP